MQESMLQRMSFRPDRYPSLEQFARANWDYLESLKRLVDTHARGLDAGATEDN